MKRSISLVIICALVLSFATPAFATCDHISSENTPAGIEYTVFYEMDDDENVIEYIRFSDINVTRTIHPDNTMTVKILGPDIEKTTVIDSDYLFFKNIYLSSIIPEPLNSDITGSQFIHRYLGSPGDSTVYLSEIEFARNVAELASILSSFLGNVKATFISSLAEIVFDRMREDGDFYKMVVSTDTYEVLFAHDNSYFIHCYHYATKYYKKNATRPFRTEYDYSQAIGG